MLRRKNGATHQNGHSENTYKDKPIGQDLCKNRWAILGFFAFCIFFVVSMINSQGSIFDFLGSGSNNNNHNHNSNNNNIIKQNVHAGHDHSYTGSENAKHDKSEQISHLKNLDAKLVVYAQEYLHGLSISEIDNPLLRSKKLQELFKFEFTKLLVNKINKGELKQPSDYQVVSLLSDLYKDSNEIVNFIQVGACDGDWTSSNDPIQKLLLRASHWRGVMMEPVPYLFSKLEKSIEKSYETNFGISDYSSRVFLLNAALSDRNGDQKFYTVNDNFAKEMPHETHALKYQIGSFDKQHIIKHLKVKKDRV